MKACLLSFLVLSSLLLTGCLPILIHAGVEADSREKAAYSAYRDTQARINSDREVAGLEKQPVMSLPEWRSTIRPGSTNVLKSPHDQ